MSNELMINQNDRNFAAQLTETLEKSQEIAETITGLTAIGVKNNSTVNTLLAEQKNQQRYQLGCTLGLLKAYLDTLPPQIAEKQKIGGVPLSMLIKIKVDQEVLDQREKMEHVDTICIEPDYWKRYRRLSEIICGYGYSMCFNQELFERFYPDGMHHFVSGFAGGYSCGFHTIAADACIETTTTQTVKQDIWKNWPFFLQRDVQDYRLDGKYLYMYHGGFNCTGENDLPYGNNVRFVNGEVYKKLQARSEETFDSQKFNIIF